MIERKYLLNAVADFIQEFANDGESPVEFASRLRLIGNSKDIMVKKARNMTDNEVLDAIRGGTPLANAYAIVSNGLASINLDMKKDGGIKPIERRRMELEIAQKIMSLFVAIS
jgi:hypothetical protein